MRKNRFHEKRNYDISHKELPEQWSDHKYIHIPYATLLKGVGLALRLMKKIDTHVLGPSAKYLWREMRKRRYSITYPARVRYALLHYLWLSHNDRLRIIKEEMEEGRDVWKDMSLEINGHKRTIKACGRWGAIILNGRLIPLDAPFIELTSITTGVTREGEEQVEHSRMDDA